MTEVMIMGPRKDIVKKVVDYIEGNLGREINLENIAEHAGYSKFHLNRIFLDETGYTIYKYLQLRRLTIAAEQLVETQMPIVEIAYEAGYDSQQAFSYAFKQVYVYSPKAYRDRGIFVPRQNKFSMCVCFRTQIDSGFLRENGEIAA